MSAYSDSYNQCLTGKDDRYNVLGNLIRFEMISINENSSSRWTYTKESLFSNSNDSIKKIFDLFSIDDCLQLFSNCVCLYDEQCSFTSKFDLSKITNRTGSIKSSRATNSNNEKWYC